MEVDNEQEQYPHIYLHNFKSVVTLIRYLKLQQTVYIIDAMQKILYHLNEKKQHINRHEYGFSLQYKWHF